MGLYSDLKKIWKKLGINGKVINYSKVSLWVVETDSADVPVARILKPGFKTPRNIDVDGFKRLDGKIIQYKISRMGWLNFEDVFELTCRGQIDNARPVFPKKRSPYIRSKRDAKIINNFV